MCVGVMWLKVYVCLLLVDWMGQRLSKNPRQTKWCVLFLLFVVHFVCCCWWVCVVVVVYYCAYCCTYFVALCKLLLHFVSVSVWLLYVVVVAVVASHEVARITLTSCRECSFPSLNFIEWRKRETFAFLKKATFSLFSSFQ